MTSGAFQRSEHTRVCVCVCVCVCTLIDGLTWSWSRSPSSSHRWLCAPWVVSPPRTHDLTVSNDTVTYTNKTSNKQTNGGSRRHIEIDSDQRNCDGTTYDLSYWQNKSFRQSVVTKWRHVVTYFLSDIQNKSGWMKHAASCSEQIAGKYK